MEDSLQDASNKRLICIVMLFAILQYFGWLEVSLQIPQMNKSEITEMKQDVSVNNSTNTIVSTSDFNQSSIENLIDSSQSMEDSSTEPTKKRKFRHFNRTNLYENSWCPQATCYNSPMCTPCSRRFLFIIATGRSGSTTLLKMFNTLPNVRLSGENYNEFYRAYQLSSNLIVEHPKDFYDEEIASKGRFMHADVKVGPFLHNAMPIGSMSCVMQNLVHTLNPPALHKEDLPFYDEEKERNKILGAKMIRVPFMKNWVPQEAADFLIDSFPCSRYIINMRSDVNSQVESVISAFGNPHEREEIRADYESQNLFLQRLFRLLGGDKAKLIDMMDWMNDASILNEVIDWLGFEGCAFESLVHENHDRYGHDETTKIDLGPNCTYPYASL
mmetsp:Transcript_25428/g.31330  ORF Transcript_25428/g.31330 Transcript_25428/m.31330 type:complete len:386 (-) Transcript_25428:255-1412(-)